MQYEPERELIRSPFESALDREISSFASFLTNGCIVIIIFMIIIMYSYSQVMRLWSQIAAFISYSL